MMTISDTLQMYFINYENDWTYIETSVSVRTGSICRLIKVITARVTICQVRVTAEGGGAASGCYSLWNMFRFWSVCCFISPENRCKILSYHKENLFVNFFFFFFQVFPLVF